MLLYDVTYKSGFQDTGVPFAYLKIVATRDFAEGAVARCTNGEERVLRCIDGKWIEGQTAESVLPPSASN